MLQYILCEAYKSFLLEMIVADKIKEGWTPLGGVNVMYHDMRDSLLYTQAMIKIVDNEGDNDYELSTSST